MKKILLSLFVGLIGLVNFGYCDKVSNLLDLIQDGSFTVEPGVNILRNIDSNDYGVYCITVSSWNPENLNYQYIKFGFKNSVSSITDPGAYLYIFNLGFYNEENPTSSVCMKVNQPYLLLENVYNSNIILGYKLYRLDVLLNTDLPQMTSLDCQSEYNLIPISSVDQNYCVNNGLCPSSGGGVCPGSGDNWSALYINDIQHLGKPIINITFPDYLDWDYTTDDEEFNLDIVGYPVDTEYIDGIIRTQNYKPTSEDFTQLVGMFAPYSKYLLFLLFIFIIWAWIKKPFKSKKL